MIKIHKNYYYSIFILIGVVLGVFVEEIIGGLLIIFGTISTSQFFSWEGLFLFGIGILTTIYFRKHVISAFKTVFLKKK